MKPLSKPIGVQLYSLRQELAQDFEGTIRELAEIGYPVVEGYNDMPLAHETIAGMINAHGLKMPCCHLPLPAGENETLVMQAIAAYDLQYVIVPWMPPEHFASADSIKRLCARLNEAQRWLNRHGVTLGYHNHEFEFTLVNGRPAYKMMVAELDPGIILEVDVYWVQTAGYDPGDLLRRLGARAPLVHLKDGPADLDRRDAPMVALGAGHVDIAGVVAAAEDHAAYLLVELDHCATDMMTAIRQSYTYLTRKGFARGNN